MAADIDITPRQHQRPISDQRPEVQVISVEIDGRTYTGSYTVKGDTVTAFWGVKRYTRTTRGAPPRTVARKALRELLRPLATIA